MKLHHLTDLHIGKLHYAPNSGVNIVPQEDVAHGNLSFYLAYLKRLKNEDLPSIIVISGDLTSFAQEVEIQKAKDFIRDILATYNNANRTPLPYLVLVPGNHDLDWSKDGYDRKIDRYARLIEDIAGEVKVLTSLLPVAFHPRYDTTIAIDNDLFIGCLNTTNLGGSTDPALANIHASIQKAYSDARQPNAVTEALNLLATIMRRDPGFVDLAELEALCTKAEGLPKNWPGIRIAVMHHNPSSVPSQDIDAYDTIINSGFVKRKLTAAGFDLILHGHKHFPYICRETYPSLVGAERSILVISGDSCGVTPSAPFFEIQFERHGILGPKDKSSWIVDVFSQSALNPQDRHLVAHEVVSTGLDLLQQQVRLGAGRHGVDPKGLQLSELDEYIRELRILLAKHQDWDDRGSRDWIADFHFQLDQYVSIFATDVWNRSSLITPRFDLYLAEQYRERLKQIRKARFESLIFSDAVYEAVVRIGWRPDQILWAKVQPTRRDDDSNSQEIVRILIRPGRGDEDRQALKKLSFDHRMYGIPLFVVSGTQNDVTDITDFAVGIGTGHRIIKSYEFDEASKTVRWANPLIRGQELRRKFIELLRDPSLQTVEQYLKTEGVMVTDPQSYRQLCQIYDRKRKASVAILDRIRALLSLQPSDIALDVGCGTGNYTIPFVNDVKLLTGLDICGEVLTYARAKHPKGLEWVESSALDTPFMPSTFSKIWGISSLHYFRGMNQTLLFEEMHRILQPGGVMVFDTEFAEQHASLWIKEFFPSLISRYRHSIFSTDQYRDWLADVGFTDVTFSFMELGPNELDFGVRLGQHDPRQYLKTDKLSAIPAFVEMDEDERDGGLAHLRQSISDGTIEGIISTYRAKASLAGDVGLVRAVKEH